MFLDLVLSFFLSVEATMAVDPYVWPLCCIGDVCTRTMLCSRTVKGVRWRARAFF